MNPEYDWICPIYDGNCPRCEWFGHKYNGRALKITRFLIISARLNLSKTRFAHTKKTQFNII